MRGLGVRVPWSALENEIRVSRGDVIRASLTQPVLQIPITSNFATAMLGARWSALENENRVSRGAVIRASLTQPVLQNPIASNFATAMLGARWSALENENG